jgi:hypothetical protein
MNDHVKHSLLPNGVRLNVDLKGAYTVSLSQLNGARMERKQGFDAAEFSFKAPGRGLHIVEVRQGGRAYVRPVSF